MSEEEHTYFMSAMRSMVTNKLIGMLDWVLETTGKRFEEDNYVEQMICNYESNQYDDKEIKEVLGEGTMESSMENMLEMVNYMNDKGYTSFSIPLYYSFREFERAIAIEILGENYNEVIKEIMKKISQCSKEKQN
jgi:DNA-binding ferritin-like protein (Dps family)